MKDVIEPEVHEVYALKRPWWRVVWACSLNTKINVNQNIDAHVSQLFQEVEVFLWITTHEIRAGLTGGGIHN